jgi:hypothetical protein
MVYSCSGFPIQKNDEQPLQPSFGTSIALPVNQFFKGGYKPSHPFDNVKYKIDG